MEDAVRTGAGEEARSGHFETEGQRSDVTCAVPTSSDRSVPGTVPSSGHPGSSPLAFFGRLPLCAATKQARA